MISFARNAIPAGAAQAVRATTVRTAVYAKTALK